MLCSLWSSHHYLTLTSVPYLYGVPVTCLQMKKRTNLDETYHVCTLVPTTWEQVRPQTPGVWVIFSPDPVAATSNLILHSLAFKVCKAVFLSAGKSVLDNACMLNRNVCFKVSLFRRFKYPAQDAQSHVTTKSKHQSSLLLNHTDRVCSVLKQMQ